MSNINNKLREINSSKKVNSPKSGILFLFTEVPQIASTVPGSWEELNKYLLNE